MLISFLYRYIAQIAVYYQPKAKSSENENVERGDINEGGGMSSTREEEEDEGRVASDSALTGSQVSRRRIIRRHINPTKRAKPVKGNHSKEGVHAVPSTSGTARHGVRQRRLPSAPQV